jgi:serine/threonine protein phosphatase PrpC
MWEIMLISENCGTTIVAASFCRSNAAIVLIVGTSMTLIVNYENADKYNIAKEIRGRG